jgi:hypothetical protein
MGGEMKTHIYYEYVIHHGNTMARYETVSARIPQELKEKIDRYNVKTSEIIRSALEEEVRKRELQELKDEVHRLKPILDRITTEEVVKSIREDRDRR